MTTLIALADAIRIEQVEARAWMDHHAAAPKGTIETLGLRTRPLGGVALLAANHSGSLLHNRAIGVGVLERADEALLDTVVAHYSHTRQGFAINLSPWAAPPETEARLAARGFQTYFHHVKWVRGVSPSPPVANTLPIAVAGPSDARRFAETIHDADTHERDANLEWTAACVGRPGWTHLLAFEGDEPVAGAALYVADNTAWLGQAHTREGFRRRGAQQALIAERIRLAEAVGATLLTTETAPDWPDLPRESLRNVARAGFRLAYERPSWIRFPG